MSKKTVTFVIIMALLVGYGAGQYLPYGRLSQSLSELSPMIRGSSQDTTQTTHSQPPVVPFVTAQVLFNAYSNNAASANSIKPVMVISELGSTAQ